MVKGSSRNINLFTYLHTSGGVCTDGRQIRPSVQEDQKRSHPDQISPVLDWADAGQERAGERSDQRRNQEANQVGRHLTGKPKIICEWLDLPRP